MTIVADLERVTVADMAIVWGVSRVHAWRRMREIGQSTPGAVTRGKRGELVTTVDAMKPHVKSTIETSADRRARKMRESVEEYVQRVDAIARDMSSLRREVDDLRRKLRI